MLIGNLLLVMFTRILKGFWQQYTNGMIYTLVYRCFKICSDWTKFYEELTFLKQISLENGYPESFINNGFKTFLDKLFIKTPEISMVEKKRNYV